MTVSQIRRAAAKAAGAIKEHDAQREVLKARLKVIQAGCPHANVKEWDHHDYGGGCDHHWVCQDCGLDKVT